MLAPVPERPQRLAVLGTPAEASVVLRALHAAGFAIPLVVSRPDARRGRGAATTPSPLKAAALELGLEVTDDLGLVAEVGAELAVVVAYGRIIPESTLARLPMVNIHFSLLPRWRGAAPVERAILAGDQRSGVCVMRVEPELDTGAVYDRVEVEIGPHETAAELRARLAQLGAETLVQRLQKGFDEAEPQVGEAVYARKIDPAELRIDWSRPAVEVERLVRVGGAWTTFREARLKVRSVRRPAVSADGAPDSLPGELSGVTVGTGEGVVELVEVQPEGKAPMDAEAWARGARPAPGELLGGV